MNNEFPAVNKYPSIDYNTKKQISKLYVDWLIEVADWRSFITLTYRDEVNPTVACKHLQRLVRDLNETIYGTRYLRKVGHSYFSYAVGLEFQKRGVLHFHMIVDQYVPFEEVHRYWNKYHGFVWIEPILDKAKTVNYVTKYVFKGGEVIPFIRDKKLIKSEFHKACEVLQGIDWDTIPEK